MVHRLARIKLGDRRHDAERVRRQHHDVLGVSGASGWRRIRDEVQGVRDARILGPRGVVEIGNARQRIEDDVLHDRAEALACRIDFGLGFARQLDRLGIAAALEIEDAVAAPTVLVIAEQDAIGIC